MNFNTDLFNIDVPPYLLILVAAIFSFLVAFFAIPSIVRVAKMKGFMDNPNGRTSHEIPTPNLGGVAIFAGTIISAVLFTGITTAHELKYIIAGMMVLFFVGLKDDFYPLVAYKKFIGQTFAILIIIIPGDLRLVSLHGFFGISDISYFISIVLTLIVFLALINSFNLIDGIDGLASGIGIITSTFFGVWFILDGHLAYAVMSFILSASLTAFFYFNVFGKKNKIFLGDTGSMIIGLLLSVFAVKFLYFEDSITCNFKFEAAPAVIFAVLIVPIIDTARVFLVRLIRGKSPFVADRNHIHHRLLDLSGSHFKTTSIIIFVNICFIILALLLQSIQVEILVLIVIVLASLLSYLPIYVMKRRMLNRE